MLSKKSTPFSPFAVSCVVCGSEASAYEEEDEDDDIFTSGVMDMLPFNDFIELVFSVEPSVCSLKRSPMVRIGRTRFSCFS